MRPLIVFGTRPQIVKANLLRDAYVELGVTPLMVHTGQHYDANLSDKFFYELHYPQPDYNLRVGSLSNKDQIEIGQKRLLRIIAAERPDIIFSVGDSNPAVTALFAAVTSQLPLAHAEAGVRSHENADPEERNRVLTDAYSDWLFCANKVSYNNVCAERCAGEPYIVGDLRYDAWLSYQPRAVHSPPVVARELRGRDYVVFSVHRQGNAYDPKTLTHIVTMLASNWPHLTVWPVHPGVAKELHRLGLFETLRSNSRLLLIEPVTYLEMLWLEMNCRAIVTDSVGVQLEAYFGKKPCVVLRNKAENASLERLGWSTRVTPTHEGLRDCAFLLESLMTRLPEAYEETLFGNGSAAHQMASITLNAPHVSRGTDDTPSEGSLVALRP